VALTQETVGKLSGKHWAFHWTRRIRVTTFSVPEGLHPSTEKGMLAHNLRAAVEAGQSVRHITERHVGNWMRNQGMLQAKLDVRPAAARRLRDLALIESMRDFGVPAPEQGNGYEAYE